MTAGNRLYPRNSERERSLCHVRAIWYECPLNPGVGQGGYGNDFVSCLHSGSLRERQF